MNVLVMGLLGAVGGFGAFVLIQGARGELTPTRIHSGIGGRVKGGGVGTLNRRLLAGLVVGVATWVATGWPVGTLLAVAAGWWGPSVISQRRAAARQINRTEAVAAWTEQLRDVVSASAGIGEALVSTARVAPTPIRPDVEDLARRLRREPPEVALAQFARAVDDPTADQVVVALRLSMAERGERLSEILTAIATDARAQASAARHIEAARSKLWRQALTVTVVMFGVITILLVFQRDYLDAYATLAGQIVIGVIGLLWATSLQMMVRLARGHEPARLLNPDTDTNPPTAAPVGSRR